MNEAVQPDTLEPLMLAGRCADGAERGKGVRFHAVPKRSNRALCGAKPGRHSAGWSSHVGETVTCPRCLKSMVNIVDQVLTWQRERRTGAPS